MAMYRTDEQELNLKRFIEFLWTVPEDDMIMREVNCGTACCIEGWRRVKLTSQHPFSNHAAEENFGIPAQVWGEITVMMDDDVRYSMREFDRLPAIKRKLAMIDVLVQQLALGKSSWTVALVNVFDGKTAQRLADAHKAELVIAAQDEEVRQLRPAIRSNPAPQAPVQREVRAGTQPAEEAALLLEEV